MEYPGQRIKIKCLVLGATDSGKTAILRRYYHKTFHHDSGVPTLGADFYTARVQNPFYCGNNNNEQQQQRRSRVNHHQQQKQHDRQQYISSSSSSRTSSSPDPNHPFSQQQFLILQMWDTPGRERIPTANNNFSRNRKRYDSVAVSDFFFRKVDAAVLVYDINSSTSFTQLLKYHAELIEMMKRKENSDVTNSSSTSSSFYRNFPILIVANKLDIYHKNQDRIKAIIQQQASKVPQRDVMGLRGKTFRGKDFPYEYRVTTSPSSSSSSPIITIQEGRPSTQNKRYPYEMTTFMETAGGNWTTDESYLNALLRSEDGSHPDKDMVLLWCKRNGLPHAEVCALDGTGIDDAMDKLTRLALESQMMKSRGFNESSFVMSGPERTETFFNFQPNDELDVHERYSPEQNRCLRLLSTFHSCLWCK